MNLHEYQGREILNYFSIRTPKGMLAFSPEEAVRCAKIIIDRTKKKSVIIKAQIHAGGRGKSGGIQIAKNLDEVYKKSKDLLGKYLITPQTSDKGKLVKKVLISEDVYISELKPPIEYYISILLNRDLEKNVIVYSKEGGVNIEEKHDLFTEEIDPILGLQLFQIRKIGFNLGLPKNLFSKFNTFLKNIYQSYKYYNSLLLEINPMIINKENEIIPVDIKMILDDNALFRHEKKYANIHYEYEDVNLLEKEAMKYDLNFIKLKGDVGCMVNGAGLAMATMDMIKFCGGNPANFLDIGGSADITRVEKAFSIILDDKSVQIILINIFGGIVRCDTVAKGVINSYSKKININNIPIIVRLQGTNEKKAKEILDNSQLPIYYTNSLKEASNKIKKILSSSL
ncbi:ADP-forming succinate--CoA ligase subunit beta [Blattabacterium cuenoti]|uniref:ADP-forming succinate--CoA ligase subunit beta n=1 Tax=Blattabacterium cuenoti TaxID=1653831 RepID=UPI00163C3D40|nr:ADP-forming succinate--CoA ligase subunit beta [Blattabacterium cuenoti]